MKYALRVLLRHKLFVTLAIASLGVAISLCSVVYGLFDAMVRPKLAIRAPYDLRQSIYRTNRYDELRAAKGEFNARLAAMTTISGATGSMTENYSSVSRGGETRNARVLRVSPNYFSLMGVPALLGRVLSESDAAAGNHPVVLSERMWNQWFPETQWSDSARILINGDPRPVVGVIALEADLPGASTDIWQLELASNPIFRSMLRLRPGVSEAALYAELKVVAAQLATMVGDAPGSTYFTLKPVVGKPFRLLGFHFALIAAVAAVFLVACLNLANLQLARGVHRARELATLSAIGASRRDLIRLMMQESAMLAAAGLALSAWLTVLGVNVMRAATPPKFGEFILQPQVSWRVFAFSAVVALAATFVIGLLPAVRLSRSDIHQALKTGEAKVGTHRAWSRGLLVAQIGLALPVLIGASLLARTVVRIRTFDIGIPMDRIISGAVVLKPETLKGRRVGDLKSDVQRLLRSEADVADVAVIVADVPAKATVSAAMDGQPPREIWPVWNYIIVSSNYLRVYGHRILEGRDFTDGEMEQSVIIDQSTAAWLWPGASAVGRQIKFGDPRSSEPWLRIVGVMANAPSLARADMGEVAVPGLGRMFVLAGVDTAPLTKRNSGISFVVRTASADAAPRLRNVLERRLIEAFPDRQHLDVRSFGRESQLYYGDLPARQNFMTGMFATFGLVALLVAALGVYAAFSQTVALRRREYAVRIALGANASEVRAFVMGEANLLVLSGIAIGLVAAVFNIEWLAAFVRSKADRYDSVAYGIVALVVFLTAALASYLPARRAVPTDLMKALSAD